MDTQWIVGLLIAVVLLIIIFVSFIAYRKKTQYDFMLKMMKKQKREQERAEQEAAFEAKREALSSDEATNIITALGGEKNVLEIEQNAIRIRVLLKDMDQVRERDLRAAGVSGIIKTAHGLQLIIGDRADQVALEMKQIVEQS